MVRTSAGMNIGRISLIVAACAMALLACDQRKPAGQGADRTALDPGAPAPQITAEELGPVATPQVAALYQGEFEAAASGEPFWELKLYNDYASFERPGLQEAGGLPGQRDYRANGARILAGPLTIVLRAAACSRESGESYPYQATVQFEGVSYEGCARRSGGGGGAVPEADWTHNIQNLLPAIDLCLGRAEKKPARVTIAYVDGDGTPSVRVLEAEGGRYECKVSGGAVTVWDSIADRNILSGEREPTFVRGPGSPPKEACVTPATNASGAAMGWYVRRNC